MDHLLRNRRLGSLATPVSNPFFIDHQVYFLHRLGVWQMHPLVHNIQSKAARSLASMVVLNVSNINFGASAFTAMVAPRLK